MSRYATALALLVAGPALAQEPDAAALPVVPLPADAVQPAVRFVAIARERGPRPRDDWSDMQVTIWDVPTGAPAARRVVLGHSRWNAALLLDSATLLRWQVPGPGGRGYTVKLLGLDGATFAVRELLAARQVTALGRAGDLVHLATSDGQVTLDLGARTVSPLAPPIVVLAQHGSDWLVEVDARVARFDAAKAKVVRRYDAIAAGSARGGRGFVEWDGGRFAVCAGRFVDASGEEPVLEFGRWASVQQVLRVLDLEDGVASEVRVRLSARGGSGVPVIPMTMQTELVGGMFRYTECRPETAARPDPAGFDWAEHVEWVTIDVATGRELLRAPYAPRDLPETDAMAQHRVPDYLREGFAASPIRAWGPAQDLAYAFLAHRGVELALERGGVVRFDAVCRSPDGDRLLVLHDGAFFHCELGARRHVRWAAPAALRQAHVALHAIALRE